MARNDCLNDLEALVDHGVRCAKASSYHPTRFIQMRAEYGTIKSIERVVTATAATPEQLQSGLLQLSHLNLLDWSLEAAVQKFPGLFSDNARVYAAWNLKIVSDHPRRREK
ncbi:MAG: hypothetical protein ACR2PA_27700 [Hyphomicrobiaceae bacterium]